MKNVSGGQGPGNGVGSRGKSLLRNIARFILITLAAAWMLFEDWVWDSIVVLMRMVARLKIISRFETMLARQNPYLLLALFTFPFLIMIPAKIYGLYLIADGKVLRGAAIFVIAKVTITALVTRLFIISKEKLLQIQTFAAFYYWFRDKKEWLYAEVRKIPAWQAAREGMVRFRHRMNTLMRSLKKK